MRILITGAAGFLGRACVEAVVAAGHIPRAIVRGGDAPCEDTQRGDLADMDLDTALAEVDAVIHAAASLEGDEAQMQRDTVAATQRLMQAVSAQTMPPRVVLAGSMSVYGADCAPNTLISEASPLESRPALRDAYTRTKLAQEAAARAACPEGEMWIARIGALYGPGRVWNGHLGVGLGPALIQMGSDGEVPLAHVRNAALALVLAAVTPVSGCEVVNVLDDERPTRAAYVAAMKRGGWPKIALPVGWRVMSAAASVLGRLPRAPGLLRKPVVNARLMPLRYDNAKLHDRLGWSPVVGFDAAMTEALS